MAIKWHQGELHLAFGVPIKIECYRNRNVWWLMQDGNYISPHATLEEAKEAAERRVAAEPRRSD